MTLHKVLLRPVIVATHVGLVAVGIAGLLGYGSTFVTQHSVLGAVLNYGLILTGVLGCYAAANHDDELEVITLYLQSVLIGLWAFFIFISLVEGKGGSWGGFFGITDWAGNLVLRALWLAGVVKVVVAHERLPDA